MNFKQINQNGLYEGFALITKSEKKVTAKGKDYLDLILSDSDGEISAKYWDYNEAAQGQFPAETLVKVRGTISQYNGADQFRIERIRRVLRLRPRGGGRRHQAQRQADRQDNGNPFFQHILLQHIYRNILASIHSCHRA